MPRAKRQQRPAVRHHAFWITPISYQARSGQKDRAWFVKALERLVNARESLDDYRAIKNAFPSFWPLPLTDGDGTDLSWHPDSHCLFLFYRDLLRRVWLRDSATLENGFHLDLLFGTVDSATIAPILSGEVGRCVEFSNRIARLTNTHPGLYSNGPFARFWADWLAGGVEYGSNCDFQRAIWTLFLESWRAKVCPKCSMYFVAQKSAQRYCSLNCSSSAHRASALKWWNKTGSARREAVLPDEKNNLNTEQTL